MPGGTNPLRPMIGEYRSDAWHWDPALKSFVLLGRPLSAEEFEAAMADHDRLRTWNRVLKEAMDPDHTQRWTVEMLPAEKTERTAKAKAGAAKRASVKEEAK